MPSSKLCGNLLTEFPPFSHIDSHWCWSLNTFISATSGLSSRKNLWRLTGTAPLKTALAVTKVEYFRTILTFYQKFLSEFENDNFSNQSFVRELVVYCIVRWLIWEKGTGCGIFSGEKIVGSWKSSLNEVQNKFSNQRDLFEAVWPVQTLRKLLKMMEHNEIIEKPGERIFGRMI